MTLIDARFILADSSFSRVVLNFNFTKSFSCFFFQERVSVLFCCSGKFWMRLSNSACFKVCLENYPRIFINEDLTGNALALS